MSMCVCVCVPVHAHDEERQTHKQLSSEGVCKRQGDGDYYYCGCFQESWEAVVKRFISCKGVSVTASQQSDVTCLQTCYQYAKIYCTAHRAVRGSEVEEVFRLATKLCIR